MAFIYSLIESAQDHYALLLLLVFLLTFSKSCAIVSLLVPGTSGLLLLGTFASASLGHFLLMWLSAGLGAIGGFWLSWRVGRRYQHHLHRLRWLSAERRAPRPQPAVFTPPRGLGGIFQPLSLSAARHPSARQRGQRRLFLALSARQRQLRSAVAADPAGARRLQLQPVVKTHYVLKRYLHAEIYSRIMIITCYLN